MTDRLLAVDIGATNIKYCLVSSDGTLLEAPRRRPTPYPCTPERLVSVVAERIRRAGVSRVGVGFPGEFADGRVLAPGNLARPGGVHTPVDPALDTYWRGYELQEELREATGADVRVVNDASLAALGASEGVGREVVITLGTGLGLALVVDGVLTRVRDVGAAAFDGRRTFDQALGERARAEDESAWLVDVVRAIRGFVEEFDATSVHLAGGNARRVTPDIFGDLALPVVIDGNFAPLRGAARLF